MDGRDPYAVWNQLTDDYMPLDGGGGECEPPPFSFRHRAVLEAFGEHEIEFVMNLAGAKPQRRRE